MRYKLSKSERITVGKSICVYFKRFVIQKLDFENIAGIIDNRYLFYKKFRIHIQIISFGPEFHESK